MVPSKAVVVHLADDFALDAVNLPPKIIDGRDHVVVLFCRLEKGIEEFFSLSQNNRRKNCALKNKRPPNLHTPPNVYVRTASQVDPISVSLHHAHTLFIEPHHHADLATSEVFKGHLGLKLVISEFDNGIPSQKQTKSDHLLVLFSQLDIFGHHFDPRHFKFIMLSQALHVTNSISLNHLDSVPFCALSPSVPHHAL